MKNRPVFTLYPQGEQAGFSAFTPWGRGHKAEKPDWILICQSRINMIQAIYKYYFLMLLFKQICALVFFFR
jgi:hypothetical protein